MLLHKLVKITGLSLFAASSLYAFTLKESIEKTIETNPEIIAEKKAQLGLGLTLDENKSKYYPKIDFDGKVETNKTQDEFDSTSSTSNVDKNGYNIGVSLSQLLYDGNLTSSQIDEATHNISANRYNSENSIDNIISETISIYNNLVKYRELALLTKEMVSTNKANLITANKQEEINGIKLETYQVTSKLNYLIDQHIDENDSLSSLQSSFKRYVGVESEANECRSVINTNNIPATLQSAIEEAINNNYEIKAQLAVIRVQREKISQTDSSFLPTFDLELKSSIDDNLALDGKGTESEQYARVNMKWNLYNGGADSITNEKERLFLEEEKKKLESISNKILESVKVNYQKYNKNKERVDILKGYVSANKNIVNIYKEEFESGTRTFVDILNAQTELYQSKKSLVNREFEVYNNYYSLLGDLSKLRPTILNSTNKCMEKEIISKKIKIDKEEVGDISDLLEEVELPILENENKEEVNINLPTEKESFNSSIFNKRDALYTINVATLKNINKAQSYMFENDLNDKSFVYKFGKNLENVKVIYGTFKTVKEANKVLQNLNKEIKSNHPYVDMLKKHEKLYYKYN